MVLIHVFVFFVVQIYGGRTYFAHFIYRQVNYLCCSTLTDPRIGRKEYITVIQTSRINLITLQTLHGMMVLSHSRITVC